MMRFTCWVHERGVCTIISREIHRGPGVYLDGTPIKRNTDVGFIAGDRQRKKEDGNHDEETEPRKPNWSQISVQILAGQAAVSAPANECLGASLSGRPKRAKSATVPLFFNTQDHRNLVQDFVGIRRAERSHPQSGKLSSLGLSA